MRALLAQEERDTSEGLWLMVNMVTALDGSVSVAGKSGGLAGDADHSHFRALRELADVILVGAGTVRAEKYHTPQLAKDVQAARVAEGRRDNPRLVVVTRNPVADLDAEFVTLDNPPDQVAGLARTWGPLVLCEGGPTLVKSLLDVPIREWFVTIAPKLAGSEHKGIAMPGFEPRDLHLARVAAVDDYLLLRYLDGGST